MGRLLRVYAGHICHKVVFCLKVLQSFCPTKEPSAKCWLLTLSLLCHDASELNLMPSVLGKNFNRQHFDFFFLFFP